MHMSFLACFSWMSIIATDMYCIFHTSLCTLSESSFCWWPRLTVGWLVPATIVFISFGLDFADIDPKFQPNHGQSSCVLSKQLPLIIFFVCPLGFSIITNICLFSLTVLNMRTVVNTTSLVCTRPTKYMLLVYIKPFILMDITWIIGFVAPFLQTDIIWYIFIVCNASQGVFIFFAYVCTQQVY